MSERQNDDGAEVTGVVQCKRAVESEPDAVACVPLDLTVNDSTGSRWKPPPEV